MSGIHISIRAPARGATISLGLSSMDLPRISIRAPARGATPGFLPDDMVLGLFQSTLPRGERLPEGDVIYGDVKISIHAPARGATGSPMCILLKFYNFNPRSREGSDFTSNISFDQLYNFNPRSREGSDLSA